ncbi:hypothetical protein ACN9M0_38180 [Streptomyces sp. R-07]|uniref:hypothetical protein n=1 Tax=unclassified Streptomyces TaxID=2593676 RepID=UPI00341BB623
MFRSRLPRRTALLLGGTTVLLLLASCTPSDDRPAPGASSRATRSTVTSPVYGSAPDPRSDPKGDPAEQRLLFEAQERLVAACMRGRGRPYQPLAWHAPEPGDGDDTQGDDVAARRREGYGGPSVIRPARAADPNGDYVRTLPPDEAKAYGAALFGTPSHRIEVNLADGVAFMNADGCVAHAERQLYGDLTLWLKAQMTVMNLAGEVSRKAADDNRAARTLPLWRDCMKARGFPYRDPAESRAAVFSAYEAVTGGPGARPEDLDRLRRREIAVAVADATCDARAGRARTLRGLEAQYRRQVTQEHAEQIASYRTLREQAAARLAGR